MSGGASLRIERDGSPGVVVLTLDRPTRRNALDGPLVGELTAAFEALSRDPEIRAIEKRRPRWARS